MSLHIRTGFAVAMLLCSWSQQVWSRDVATIYSPQPEPEGSQPRPTAGRGGSLPLGPFTPTAWSYRLQGGEYFARQPMLSPFSLVESTGIPAPQLEFSHGGMPDSRERSYFHMAARGSVLVIGSELAMLGVMMMLPRETTKWEPDFVQDAVHNLGRHVVSPPVWDEDNWLLNYLGHPYAGSLYYNTVRAQGGSAAQSFIFALGASTFWEYVVEATAEPASTQDLIVTPVAGAILGELVHRLTLELKRGGTSVLEGILITILNPTHVVMAGYD